MDNEQEQKVSEKLKTSQSSREEGTLEPQLYNGRLFFSVSPLKFIVMSMCTFGLYELFWQYKNWQLISERTGRKLHSFWRAFFAYVFIYELLKEIRQVANDRGVINTMPAGMLAAAWIIVTLTWKAPEPISHLSTFAFIALLPAIQLINRVATTTSEGEPNSKFSVMNWVAIVIGGGLLFLTFLGSLMQ